MYDSLGKLLLIVGGTLVLAGALFFLLGRLPSSGRLPGDLLFQRGPVTFLVPLVTMLLVSAVLTIVLNIVLRLRHR